MTPQHPAAEREDGLAALREAVERAEHDCPDCEGVWWIRGEDEESDTTCWNPLHRAFHQALAAADNHSPTTARDGPALSELRDMHERLHELTWDECEVCGIIRAALVVPGEALRTAYQRGRRDGAEQAEYERTHGESAPATTETTDHE